MSDRKLSYNKLYSRSHRPKMNGLRKKWLIKRKAWLYSIKEGLKCEVCSENNPVCLDFHHKDPKNKSFDISTKYKTTADNDVILEEIKKCAVLGANCHRKFHNEMGGENY